MKKHLLLAASLVMTLSASANWGNTIDDPTAIFPTGTSSYATEVYPGPDGSVWGVIYHPNLKNAESETDINNVVYEYRLQHWDKDGNPTFPTEGLLVSDYANISYTVVNKYLIVDHEGNAILSVSDCRNSSERARSYTAYKISPKGEMLWGEDGVALNDPLNPPAFTACMNIVELEDHSFVFAWMQGDGAISHVYMQRLTNDGKAQWDLKKTAITDEISENPIMVNGGENTAIIMYTRGSSANLYARKVDFEGENVWGKDVRIYRGGWGSMPPHVYFTCAPSGDGGLLATWFDDRNNTNLESAYMSYITSGGKIAFSGLSDDGDLKLSYNQLRNFRPFAVAAADGSCFYAVWRATSGNQAEQAIIMQKVSKEGELLWGDEAYELSPLEAKAKSYTSIQAAGENDAVAFFEIYNNYNDQQCFAARVNGNHEVVWNDGKPLAISRPARKSESLESQVMPGQNAYLCTWSDGGTGESSDDPSGEQEEASKRTTYLMMRLNEDGTFGLPGSGVESIEAEDAPMSFDGECLHASLADGTLVSVYAANGAKVADCALLNGVARLDLPAGIYVAVADGNAVKVAVK